MSTDKLDLILDELAKVNKGLGGLEDKFAGLDIKVDGIENKLDDLATKSDAILVQVMKNSEDLTAIKDSQQTLIRDIIKRQEDTINILARRSIDQEAEIMRIK